MAETLRTDHKDCVNALCGSTLVWSQAKIIIFIITSCIGFRSYLHYYHYNYNNKSLWESLHKWTSTTCCIFMVVLWLVFMFEYDSFLIFEHSNWLCYSKKNNDNNNYLCMQTQNNYSFRYWEYQLYFNNDVMKKGWRMWSQYSQVNISRVLCVCVCVCGWVCLCVI